MQKKSLIILLILFGISFVCAESNGTFIGNQTNTVTNISAQFDVVASLSATEYWAEVWLNTSEINFGQVEAGQDSDLYRQKYRIKARGNVNIEIVPSLVNNNDNIFSNLYLSRTYSNWERIGDYKMIFNLTENKGAWSTVESSGLVNATSSNGLQSIKLDLSDFEEIIPFDQEYRNTVKFVVIPVWSSVE